MTPTSFPHPDIWGWCADCDAWFACPGFLDRTKPPTVCTECGDDPDAIENRAAMLVTA